MKTVIIVSSLVLFSAAYICADNAQIVESYGKIPLAFTVNQGQTDPQVRFTTQGNGCSMLFTPTGTIFYMSRETGDSVAKRNVQKTAKTSGDLEPDNQSGREYESFAFKTVFVGAHSNPDMVGEDRLTWNNNYFIGKDTSKWQTDVPNYGKVRLVEVYDSIDLVYYGDKNRIKYDFVVKSGEDPSTIVLQYYLGENTGNALSINRAGELVVTTPFGDIIEDTPYCYQEINGRKVEVSIRYRIIDASLNIFGFETGNYDTNVDLVIDPALVYSTFLGGNDFDKGTGIAVDSSGNAYVTGYTQSVENYSLPNPFGGLFSNFNINQGDGWGGTFGEGFGKQNSLGSKDIFVAKIKASGNGLAYATFIGGGGWDEANGIALDSSGCVYITGYTESDDYPVTNGAFDTSLFFSSYNVPGTDVFVTKLNAAGNSLAYSTYIGDSGPDYAYAIAVDGSGNAYVTGYTESFQWYLGTSVTNGAYDNTYNFKDAFVTKLNASGTNIVYFTYLGGTGYDTGTGIAVDSSGNAYVTGYTASTNFPVTNGA
ncbi:MAG: SBBP repeat-containing protein, partial [Candidatus Latescibacteria bacterium]|nr:SBBP repeat-containing protein [Candidatus Latescibacterota bacterium]